MELDWHLLSPPDDFLPSPIARDRPLCERLIPAMRVARERAFTSLGQRIPLTNPEDPWSDWNAWHLIATQKADGAVAGAVRLFVLHRRTRPVILRDLLVPCGIAFASPADEDLYEEAFQELLETFDDEAKFIYVGPLFVSAPWRRRGLGAVLGLGGNAIFRIHDCRLGLTLATTRDRAADLFVRLGAYRLRSNGIVLRPFYCFRHGEYAEMLAIHPARVEPQLEQTIEALRHQFGIQAGVIHPAYSIPDGPGTMEGIGSRKLALS